MKWSKSLILGASLSAIMAISPGYAKNADNGAALNSTEVGTLATIAAIDKAEVLIGVVASNKKVDAGVQDFAKMMIDQHGGNLTQIMQMIKDAQLKALNGGIADKVGADSKKDLVDLGGLDGNEFAMAYVNAMVKGHQGALNLIDTQLMKTAKSEEMKKFMTDTRAAVAMHLEHAKKLQAEMKS